MAPSDLFRRTIEAGTSFLDMSRERAEAVVKEWVDAGDLGRGTAKKAVDDLLDRSRKITDELGTMIRREISDQLTALGVATRDDLARVEAKIDAAAAPGGPAPRASTVTPRRRTTKAAPVKKAASRAAATKAANKAPAKKAAKNAPAKKATRRRPSGPGPGP